MSSFLTHSDLSKFFSQIVYYPGWEFEVVEQFPEGLHLHIRCTLPNSYAEAPGADPSKPKFVSLDIISPLPPMRDIQAVKDWLVWRLSRIATHETREWLRFEGELISDPHGEPVKT